MLRGVRNQGRVKEEAKERGRVRESKERVRREKKKEKGTKEGGGKGREMK